MRRVKAGESRTIDICSKSIHANKYEGHTEKYPGDHSSRNFQRGLISISFPASSLPVHVIIVLFGQSISSPRVLSAPISLLMLSLVNDSVTWIILLGSSREILTDRGRVDILKMLCILRIRPDPNALISDTNNDGKKPRFIHQRSFLPHANSLSVSPIPP